MVNLMICVGRLGKNPESRLTSGGTEVSNFSVALSKRWKDKQGNSQEKTEWVNIVTWGKLAEFCGEYLKKGDQVYVEGELETQKWTDKNGVEKYKTVVNAHTVNSLSRNTNSEPPNQQTPDDESSRVMVPSEEDLFG